MPVSPVFGLEVPRAKAITPVLSASSAATPAEPPLGGVCAGVDESQVNAACTPSAGSVTLAGNGSELKAGTVVMMSWFELDELAW